jgi:hypothetical protein
MVTTERKQTITDDYTVKFRHTLLNGKLNGPFKFYDEKNIKKSRITM